MQTSRSAERDEAHMRLRRATAIALAGAGALVAAFAGLAANALPGRRTTTTTANTSPASSSTRATPPPLVPVENAGTPASPTSAPQQTQSPPVAVSGGS
ncbi:MAG: hypothetical protein ACYDA3_01870 [Gaiellaceae bacterium]